MILRLIISLAAIALSGAAANATSNSGLSAIHAVTALRYSNVEHVASDSVASLLKAAPADVLLLDVREAEEYAVSRLPGAVRVAPDMSTEAFAERFSDKLAGRRVVVYCSVGVRSSGLASRIGKAARDAGAQSVANLTGGIFNWHNEARPLVAGEGGTERIHPYDRFWSRLIERRALISYGPTAPSDGSPAAGNTTTR